MSHIDERLKAIDARTFEARVGAVVRRAHVSIRMTESDPLVIMTALNDLLLLFLATELGHLPRPEVRRQAFRFYRTRMDEMLRKQDIAAKMIEGANDE